MLEQLAEESSELAKAALKLARVLRKENPTPVTATEAQKNLIEEFTDVFMCAAELRLEPDIKQAAAKQKRFTERWNKQHDTSTPKTIEDLVKMSDEEFVRWFFGRKS